MKETTRKMEVGGADYRERLTITFIPSRDKRYKEVYCIGCRKKVLETHDDVAIISDVSNIAFSDGVGSPFGISCQGYCRIWYEVKTIPGLFDFEAVRIFFMDTRKKYRTVHCFACKEPFATVTSGEVFGMKDPYHALKSDDGFVPTYCPTCLNEFEITTNVS